MKIILKIFETIAQARMRRERERLLAQLDERTLRDIGLEREANRKRDLQRLSLRFGMY